MGRHLRLFEQKGGRILSGESFEVVNEVGLIIIAARECNVTPAVRVFFNRLENSLKPNDAGEQFGAESHADLESALELAFA